MIPMKPITRRSFVSGAGAAALACGLAPSPSRGGSDADLPLRARAARKGMRFGSAVMMQHLHQMPELGAAIIRECAVIVPENEMKWRYVEKVRGRPDYRDADQLAAFAAGNGLAMRGHTALWYRNSPSWLEPDLKTPAGRGLLLDHVTQLVGRFRGRVGEWDVVNEMIEPQDNLPHDMRNWPPFAPGDVGFLADCFHAARAADPGALLFYNDYGYEYSDRERIGERRRAGTLELIAALKSRNAPIGALGVQCHATVGNRFVAKEYRKFLADVASLGVKIVLTEFDVNDKRVKGDIAERDRQVADHAREILTVAFDERACTGLLTWGLTSRYSWLSTSEDPRDRRPDGLSARSLPLDENLVRTPLWFAIADCFDKAAPRN